MSHLPCYSSSPSPTAKLCLPATPSSTQPRSCVTIAPCSSPPFFHSNVFPISPATIAISSPQRCHPSPAAILHLLPVTSAVASSAFSPTPTIVAVALIGHSRYPLLQPPLLPVASQPFIFSARRLSATAHAISFTTAQSPSSTYFSLTLLLPPLPSPLLKQLKPQSQPSWPQLLPSPLASSASCDVPTLYLQHPLPVSRSTHHLLYCCPTAILHLHQHLLSPTPSPAAVLDPPLQSM
ncbi:hypothetical protein BHE74_00022008 [Ensete ventricosum]|nr:hypothetical protein BHE74_00022008 [Ensete ventricosum]